MTTVPEKKGTIEAQMRWLKQGKRVAVLITPGERLPRDVGLWHVCSVLEGLVIYNGEKVSKDAIEKMAEENRLGELLGYGIASKPKKPMGAVVVRGRNGVEKQAVVTDRKNYRKVVNAAIRVADATDQVRLEPCEKVLEDRKQDVIGGFVTLRPAKPDDLRALVDAAALDGHRVLAPSHIIDKGGEIAGYIGLNSLPTFQGWFDRGKVKARDSATIFNIVENLCRAQGMRHLALLLPETSDFRGVIDRFGYERLATVTLEVKEL